MCVPQGHCGTLIKLCPTSSENTLNYALLRFSGDEQSTHALHYERGFNHDRINAYLAWRDITESRHHYNAAEYY